MRHVDEGTIHAWLDGQVSDPAEAAWIEEHLHSCASCAASLAAERATLEQADALLAAVAPVADAGRPAYDALVARSKASAPAVSTTIQPSRSRTWLIPAGWAASVALAFGIGWSIREPSVRDAVRQTPLEAPAAVSSVETSKATAEAAAVGRSDVSQQPAAVEGTGRGAARVQASPPRLAKTVAAPAQEPSEVRAASKQPETLAPTQVVEAPLNQVVVPFQGVGQGRSQGGAVPVTAAAEGQSKVTPAVSGTAVFDSSSTASPSGFLGTPQAAARGGRGGGGGGGGGGRAAGARFDGANAGRILVDGVAINTGTPAGLSWRTLPRTQAAVSSGMPLYGIDGLTPSLTMVSADNTIVRTVYRLESGETVEVMQQSVRSPSVFPNAQVTVAAEAPVLDVQNARQGPPSARPFYTDEWSTERDGVRLTLRGAANLPALGERLRVD